MRVRTFELRLLGAAMAVGWAITAGLLLAGYRPGGPFDLWVAMAVAGPLLLSLAGLRWPPLTRGDRAFAVTAWLGLGVLLLMAPSIAGILRQLTAGGPQTLLPSLEAAYPWALALLGTGLYSGLGVARRWLGEGATKGHRLVRGVSIGAFGAIVAGGIFTGVAIGNEIALRDRPIPGSRFGPTDPSGEPPTCDAPIRVGPAARLTLSLDASVDGRSIGTTSISGVRDGGNFRWSGYLATDRFLGQYAAARVDGQGWRREVSAGWVRAEAGLVKDDTIDSQVLAVALLASNRPAPEERGIAIVEGARARECRIQLDGPTFRAAFPQVQRLIGDADLARWRGELDYWVFLDGQLGMVDATATGDAHGMGRQGLQGEVRVSMTATDRDLRVAIFPPGR